MKNTVVFVVAGAAVLVFLFYLSLSKKVPPLPADAFHKVVTGDEGCVVCHAPGKMAPLKKSHPPKEQCLTCHKINKS